MGSLRCKTPACVYVIFEVIKMHVQYLINRNQKSQRRVVINESFGLPCFGFWNSFPINTP